MDTVGNQERDCINLSQCPHLERVFPKLASAGYEKTSQRTGRFPLPGAYNCIAWAANDTHHWWWPENGFWPFWLDRAVTIDCFVRAFRWLGYRKCGHSGREIGFEKIALYTFRGVPTHMARQLSDGSWTSKIGAEEDITHYTLDALESYSAPHGEYGDAVLYMRRLIAVSWLVQVMQFFYWRFEVLKGNS